MVNNLSKEQIQGICAWLGLEAVERESDEIFQMGKELLFLTENVNEP